MCPIRSKIAACGASACAARLPIPTFGRSTCRFATTARWPHPVTLALSFGPSAGGPGNLPAGFERLTLAPGADRETTFQFRTRVAGFLQAQLLPHDAFPADDRATLQLPAQPALRVTVYSAEPDLLRPVLAASPAGGSHFPRIPRNTARRLLVRSSSSIDSIRQRPRVSIPSGSIPRLVARRYPCARACPTRRSLTGSPTVRLGAGLRAKDFRLESASVFEAAPDDLKIAEVDEGPVVVARPGKPKIVVFGFHPALSAMRYELATPLLFANLLRWMAPEIFRRWELTAGSVGTVKVPLDPDVRPADVRVVREDGNPAPFTLRGQSLEFFSGTPGTVRVLAGDREYVYSLTLPQLWESKWDVPPETHRGIPRFAAPLARSHRPVAMAGAGRRRVHCWRNGSCTAASAGVSARVSRRPVAMRKAS